MESGIYDVTSFFISEDESSRLICGYWHDQYYFASEGQYTILDKLSAIVILFRNTMEA
jgi:hypothetical protein